MYELFYGLLGACRHGDVETCLGDWVEKVCRRDVVLGDGGIVGGAVAKTLLAAGHAVTVVTRSASKAAQWQQKGAQTAVLDLHDTEALSGVFKRATRAFLLNPPAMVASNTDVVERLSVSAILAALRGVALEKIVVQSTYGSQAGKHSAGLGGLYEFEHGAQQLGIPLCCVRAAYYLSNWCGAWPQVQATGVLTSLLPAAEPVPMVAPEDVGQFAAHLLAAPVAEVGVYAIEGPQRYSPFEVSQVMGRIMGRTVCVEVIPPEQWQAYYRQNGFSEQAARSYATMTDIFVNKRYVQPKAPYKGATALEPYMHRVLAAV